MLEEHIRTLSDKNPTQRQAARLALIELGAPAVEPLIGALSDTEPHVRWEAAKALAGIKSANACEALVGTLCDDETDVRWVAADALVEIGPDSLAPLLKSMLNTKFPDPLYQSAHHVLRGLDKAGNLDVDVQPVLAALATSEPEVSVPVAANELLAKL